MGQNLALTLEAEGEYSFQHVHANRAIKWKTPNKRYIIDFWVKQQSWVEVNYDIKLWYSCEILLGDLQSEEERDIVLEMSVPPVPLGTQLPVLGQPMFTAQLSYFNIITAQMDRIECQLTVTRDCKDLRSRVQSLWVPECLPYIPYSWLILGHLAKLEGNHENKIFTGGVVP